MASDRSPAGAASASERVAADVPRPSKPATWRSSVPGSIAPSLGQSSLTAW